MSDFEQALIENKKFLADLEHAAVENAFQTDVAYVDDRGCSGGCAFLRCSVAETDCVRDSICAHRRTPPLTMMVLLVLFTLLHMCSVICHFSTITLNLEEITHTHTHKQSQSHKYV